MSRTAVESSGDVNVSVASHLSNFPVMATDASTSNFIVLSAGVISKTGACARVADGNMASIKTRRIVNLIEASLEDKRHSNLSYNFYFTKGRLERTNLINTLTCHSFFDNSRLTL